MVVVKNAVIIAIVVVIACIVVVVLVVSVDVINPPPDERYSSLPSTIVIIRASDNLLPMRNLPSSPAVNTLPFAIITTKGAEPPLDQF